VNYIGALYPAYMPDVARCALERLTALGVERLAAQFIEGDGTLITGMHPETGERWLLLALEHADSVDVIEERYSAALDVLATFAGDAQFGIAVDGRWAGNDVAALHRTDERFGLDLMVLDVLEWKAYGSRSKSN
jgi:hypothetical protein